MTDKDNLKTELNRLRQTLNAAVNFVSENEQLAQRVQQNWSNKKSDGVGADAPTEQNLTD